jgi:hypothetical protein
VAAWLSLNLRRPLNDGESSLTSFSLLARLGASMAALYALLLLDRGSGSGDLRAIRPFGSLSSRFDIRHVSRATE